MREWDRMIGGLHYDPRDAELMRARQRALDLVRQFNQVPPGAEDARRSALRTLLGRCGERVRVESPFHCDYGVNIDFGDDVYLNVNCVVLDCASVRVGRRTLIGSGVQLITAAHPLDAGERAAGLESALPVVLGDDVWIGSGAIVCPGVSIGARSVIGAGSVVVRDVPPDVVAAGNPCRVRRSLLQR